MNNTNFSTLFLKIVILLTYFLRMQWTVQGPVFGAVCDFLFCYGRPME